MRFFILMAVFGVIAIVLETTWLSGFPADSLRFDFIIIAVAALSFNLEWRKALPVIVFYGIIMDLASSAPFGMSIFSYVIIYILVRAIVAQISFQAGLALLFWVCIVSLADKVLCSLVVSVANGDLAVLRIMLKRAPMQAIFDSVVALGLVPFLLWYWDLSWEKITRPKGLVLK